jgi:predicted ferric reductase
MTLWQSVTWDVARAGGFTAYILLTLSVALGLALSTRLQSPRWPRLINSELHNYLTLVGAIFLVVHVVAVWLDPFTRFGWNEVLIPFASHYRPLWMGLGIVALYLAIAVGISTWLRPRIGYAAWRRLHALTFAVYALATVHGIATGSDTRTAWGVAVYAGSVLLVGVLLWTRLLTPATPQGRRHPVLATLTVAAAFVLALWAALGPLRPGWSRTASSGQTSGASIARTVAAAAGVVQAAELSGPPSGRAT